jgi:hypothetical protein
MHPGQPSNPVLVEGFGLAQPRFPFRTSVRLSAPLGALEKVLLTDICNQRTARAPVDRAIPEHRGLRRN